MRILFITLLVSSLVFTAHPPANAQVRGVKVINSVSVSEIAEGTLVTIVADQPLAYVTRENDGGFQLIIPGAGDSVSKSNAYDGKFVKVQTERRDNNAIFWFNLPEQSNFKVKNNSSSAESAFKIEVLVSPKEAKDYRRRRPANSNTVTASSSSAADRSEDSPVKTVQPVFTAISDGKSANARNSEAAVEVKKTNFEAKNLSDAASDTPSREAKATLSTLKIRRVSGPPSLKSYIDKKAGLVGTEVADFRQLAPNDGTPASQPTKAYISYDDANLYVVFVCRADPKQVRARMAKREDIWEDDQVSVVLDTFHDQRRAYVFSVNPLGVQYDSIKTEGQGEDESFDTLWYSDGRLTPDGFVASIQIPFKSLRFPDAEVQSWGIALRRIIAHKNEEAYYPYVTQRKQGLLQQIATLEGLEQISPGRNVQIIPYYVASAERSLATAAPDNTPYFRTFTDVRAGMDAKIVVKNALTLDLTLNPDFSQVESDEPQVTVNRRFETFFPEKRPFFIENAAFFNTPENLFFSRRIIDPQFGARLTGKAGKWALGGLLIDDKAAGQFFSPGSFEYGKRAVAGVFRLSRELGDQSSVGVLLTRYHFASASNTVFSVDNRIKLNENWSFTGQFIRSYTTQRGKSAPESGEAYLASLTRSGRKFNYDFTYYDRSPNFKSQLGFIPRVDIRQVEQNASYRWRPNKKGINSFGPSVYASSNWNRQGTLQDWYLWAGFGVDLTNLTSVNVSRAKSYELFLGQGFYTDNTSLSFNTDWLGWLGVYGSYGWGSSVNYSTPVNLNPFKADSAGGSVGVNFRPSSQFSLKQTYIFSRLETRRGDLFSGAAGGTGIFSNHILRSKLNYQFNRRVSLRAIIDYNAVLPNSALIDLEESKRFTGDILLTYMINPGTAIYVGYTDTYENLLLSHAAPTAVLIRTRSPFNPTGRRFFIKVNNLFRF